MQLIAFSKALKEKSVDDLVRLGRELGLDGYDLCVRPGYPINPDNVAHELASAVQLFASQGLSVPMVTGAFDLLMPNHPTAEPLLAAMDKANVRLLKLGYFIFDPFKQDYWKEVERVRDTFSGWETLARRYGVKICYHTHAYRCMGLNCGMLTHLIRGFDPRFIGAYLDPGHMAIEGEEFAVGVAMVREHLSIIGLKDLRVECVAKNGHGAKKSVWVEAGQGMVDWTAVFSELARVGFTGPLSIHCEFATPPDGFVAGLAREIHFFRRLLNGLQRPSFTSVTGTTTPTAGNVTGRKAQT